MIAKATKQPPISGEDPTVSELFVFGLDENNKPRGARFLDSRDETIKAATEMQCRTVVKPPAAFAEFGMELQLGRIFSSGKSFIPSISRDLYDRLLQAERMIGHVADAVTAGIAIDKLNNLSPIPDDGTADALPTYPSLPKKWESIDVGDQVLIHGGRDVGWWIAVVIERVQNILTLRLRDYPKQGTFVRHRSSVALINPGRVLPSSAPLPPEIGGSS